MAAGDLFVWNYLLFGMPSADLLTIAVPVTLWPNIVYSKIVCLGNMELRRELKTNLLSIIKKILNQS